MARHYDDPSISPTLYVVALLTVLFIGAVFALEGYFGRVSEEVAEEKIRSQSSAELDRVRAEQTQRISRYEWVDREAGVVTIPVERAMELIATELTETGGSVKTPEASGQ